MREAGAVAGGPGRKVVAVIAIDPDQRGSPLETAVNGALAVAEVFRGLGFEPITLLDERATAAAIDKLVHDELAALDGSDSLIALVAGRFVLDQASHSYLVAADGTPIAVAAWLQALGALGARHVLAILDASWSGIALPPAFVDPAALRRDERLGLRAAFRSRIVVTSAGPDDAVASAGPIVGCSLFIGCLVDELSSELPRTRAGTTAWRLAERVRDRVRAESRAEQTPGLGAFSSDDAGDMVIRLPDVRERTAPPRPAATLGGDGARSAPGADPSSSVEHGSPDVDRKDRFRFLDIPEDDSDLDIPFEAGRAPPAGTGVARAAPAAEAGAPPARRVDLQLERMARSGRRWVATQLAKPGRHHRLCVVIGAALPGSLLATPPPGLDDLLPPPTAPEGHRLEVAVFGLGFQVTGPAVQQVVLPPSGPSRPLYFGLRVVADQPPRARVILYWNNHALQSFLVAPADPGKPGKLTAALEFSRTADFRNLAELAPRIASFAVNDLDGATHSFMAKGDAGSASVASLGAAQLAALTRTLRGQLATATFRPDGTGRFPVGGTGDPASLEFRTAFQALAHAGQDLYDALAQRTRRTGAAGDGAGLDPAPLAAIAASEGKTIQIVRFDLDYAFPWPLLYDGFLPPLIAAAGGGHVPPSEICLGGSDCRHLAGEAAGEIGYCVKGFWGVRHVVEQLLGRGSEQAAREIQVPGAARGVHVALGIQSQFGHAIERHAVEIARERARILPPDVATLLDTLWDNTARPAQLIVYSHVEVESFPGEPVGRRVVFMDGAVRRFLRTKDISDRFRRARGAPWSDPRTVVFLMTCSGVTDEDLLTDFAKSFYSVGAAAVVGAEVPVFEALVSAFTCQVTRDWWTQATLGEAVRRFRHDLMRAGSPLGLVFNVLGSADLRVR